VTEPIRVRVAALGELPAAAVLAGRLGGGFDAGALGRHLASGRGLVWLAGPPGAAQGVLVDEQVAEELHVHALAVAPSARRRGVASALLERALARARAAGARRVQLELRASNRAALALYGRFGLLPVGRRPAYYAGGEDALLLSGALDPATGVSGPLP
jgi:ribosomal-protein-alanine N-acetyltransferase